MKIEEMTIPPVFRPLNVGDKIGVHDYSFHENGWFDYVDDVYSNQTLVAYASDARSFFVRPIVAVLEILDMLQSDVCVCGDYKPRSRSHCSACYISLPREHAKALYRRFRGGYEQAFLQSLIDLIEIGRTTPELIRAAVPTRKA